ILASWLVVLCAVAGGSLLLHVRYRRAAPPADQAERWGRRRIVTALCYGCAYGSAGIVMFRPELTGHQMLLTIFLFAMTSIGSLTAYSTFLPLLYAFTIPTNAPFLILSGLQGDFAHLMIAATGLVNLGFVVYFSIKLNRLLAESINLRFESLERL